jgi:hypothetical protein
MSYYPQLVAHTLPLKTNTIGNQILTTGEEGKPGKTQQNATIDASRKWPHLVIPAFSHIYKPKVRLSQQFGLGLQPVSGGALPPVLSINNNNF